MAHTISNSNSKEFRGSNYGINYAGNLPVNMDIETGFRYGVISVHQLPFFYDEAEADYEEFDQNNPDHFISELSKSASEEEREQELEEAKQRFYDSSEPLSWGINRPDLSMNHDCDDIDVFVTKSLYYTCAQYCSPCAPGACYLINQCDSNGPKAYCPPPDHFEEGECPIVIYSIETGKIVRFIEKGAK